MKKNEKKTIEPQKRNLILFVTILFVITGALYYNTYTFDYSTFRDTALIKDNWPTISSTGNIPKAFVTDTYLTHSHTTYRPVQTTAFILESQFTDGNPWIYHFGYPVILCPEKNIRKPDDLVFLSSAVCSASITRFGSLLDTRAGIFIHAGFWTCIISGINALYAKQEDHLSSSACRMANVSNVFF
jgi:hypothetical protein